MKNNKNILFFSISNLTYDRAWCWLLFLDFKLIKGIFSGVKGLTGTKALVPGPKLHQITPLIHLKSKKNQALSILSRLLGDP
jgi:hypothetical protein